MPQVTVTSVEEVGTHTVAVEFDTPAGLDADPGQFFLVRATVDGVEETGYYTLSSPDTEEGLEITVEAPPETTLARWLAERSPGDEVELEGPFGDVRYAGEGAAVVLAEGPGIGPAVGIGERAVRAGHGATVVFQGEDPPHRDRLDALADRGATVLVVHSLDDPDVADALDSADEAAVVYAFGFESFVREAKAVAESAGVDLRAESFGTR